MLNNPHLIFNKNKRNIKFHFDMWHGEGNLDKAIEKLPIKEKNTLFSYYDSLFPWLLECEKIFGFKNDNYGLKRIYGFLAERYLSYWFKKYKKISTLPFVFKDISDFL